MPLKGLLNPQNVLDIFSYLEDDYSENIHKQSVKKSIDKYIEYFKKKQELGQLSESDNKELAVSYYNLGFYYMYETNISKLDLNNIKNFESLNNIPEFKLMIESFENSIKCNEPEISSNTYEEIGNLYKEIYDNIAKKSEFKDYIQNKSIDAFIESANLGDIISLVTIQERWELFEEFKEILFDYPMSPDFPYKKLEELIIKWAILGNKHCIDILCGIVSTIDNDDIVYKTESHRLFVEETNKKYIDVLCSLEYDFEDKQYIRDLQTSNGKILSKIYCSVESDTCVICSEQLIGTKYSVNILVCGHAYHGTCIRKSSKCPLCAMPLDKK